MSNRFFNAVFPPIPDGMDLCKSRSLTHTQRNASPWLTGILCIALSSCLAAAEDPRIAASQDYATRLGQELSMKLKTAMQESGPVSAIEVCQIEAPRIAAELSSTGEPVRVGRTAVKVRNPNNAPDEQERRVLEQFALSLADGEKPPLSKFIIEPDGSARYMQTIIMQPPCLACHGGSLPENVQTALAERYPEDQATGFEVGDLRGAFVIDWPAPGM